MNTSDIGDIGEQIAENYLRDQGFYIVARNYKAGTGRACVGEIDIAAIKGNTLHVVEVKTRRNTATSGDFAPEAAYTPTKISRLHRAARQFCIENRHQGDTSFDLISINLPPDGRPAAIRHYINII